MREDAVRLGPQHLRDGRIRYRQAKNEHRSLVDLDIPVHPDLQQVIDSAPSGHGRTRERDGGLPVMSTENDNMKKLLTTVVFLTIAVTPVFAQSFAPEYGSGNIVSGNKSGW